CCCWANAERSVNVKKMNATMQQRTIHCETDPGFPAVSALASRRRLLPQAFVHSMVPGIECAGSCNNCAVRLINRLRWRSCLLLDTLKSRGPSFYCLVWSGG